ncbi:hypothetical protein ES703_84773 [subsurface metagenome]
MLAAVHRPDVDEGVGVVGRRADDGINVLLVEALAPVRVGFGPGEAPGCGGEGLVVYITQGDNVLALDVVRIRTTTPTDADDGDIELLIRRPAGLENPRLQGHQSCSGHSVSLEERTTLHIKIHKSPPSFTATKNQRLSSYARTLFIE